MPVIADDLTVDNGAGTDYDVATDDDGSGNHVQIVKLAMAADGSRTAIPADSDGMLVNLGTNNDVTVSGVSTAANQSTMIGHLDGVEGLLTTIDADTGTIAGAVSGTEMQVDIVSAPTLTVNSHAVTNAGTFAVQVTSLPASTNTIEVVGDAAHDAAAAGNPVLIGAEFDDSSPDSVDEGDVGRLRISANRNLYSTIRDAAGNERGANVNASNQLSVSVDNTVTVASHAVTNAGTFVTQENGSALTALQLIDDIVRTDDAAFAVGTDEVAMAGFLVDETSTDSADEGDAAAARVTANRQQIVTVRPNANGEGLDIFRTLDADETEEEIKGTAGKVYGYYIYNDGAAEVYVKFYNATAANVTVGSTTPVLTFGIPAGSGANAEFTNGIAFGTAITIAATTGVGDADTTAPAANQVVANVFYK